MKVQIFVSTMRGESIDQFSTQNSFLPSINFINQSLDAQSHFLNIYNYNEAGLSKSRNRAIMLSDCDYLVLTDNDVHYEQDFIKNLEQAIIDSKHAEAIWFKQSGKNKYPKNNKFISYRSALRCSSIEVAYKLSFIRDKNLRFNELFGLGSKFPTGEENLFLFSILNHGGKIYYANFVGVKHDHISSGQDLAKAEVQMAKGALFAALYDRFALFYIWLFFIKKLFKFKFKIKALKNMLKGRREYLLLL